jgi:hypothetical protein
VREIRRVLSETYPVSLGHVYTEEDNEPDAEPDQHAAPPRKHISADMAAQKRRRGTGYRGPARLDPSLVDDEEEEEEERGEIARTPVSTERRGRRTARRASDDVSV